VLKSSTLVSGYLRLGKREDAPILVKLKEESDKATVFRSCHKLRGTKISIKEDLSRQTRIQRAGKMETLKKLRQEGKNVHFKGPNVLVDGRPYNGTY
jgi:hypothetical protein